MQVVNTFILITGHHVEKQERGCDLSSVLVYGCGYLLEAVPPSVDLMYTELKKVEQGHFFSTQERAFEADN